MSTSRTIWTWFQGTWHQGNYPILGAADHAAWLGTMIFDGARTFDGVSPDLDLHCARANDSARKMGLNPVMSDAEITEIAREGISRFSKESAIYVRPMMWSREGGASMVLADPDSTEMAICLEERPMPPLKGLSITTTAFSRPMHSMAPTDAKAGCLYPNNARMLREAFKKGFDNTITLDPLGNVAETATSNIWMVRDGVAMTPIPNGTFLNGITRQRVLKLLKEDGIEAVECTLTLDDFRNADEIFTTGNANKVVPVTRFDEREYAYGPISRKARDLYWEYAHQTG